jgi:hypothetical protein
MFASVKCVRYLGVEFYFNGQFKRTQEIIADQGRKALFILYRRLHNFPTLTADHQIELFDKFILPILNYGAESWGCHLAPNIESVHISFCKRILGVKRSAQNDMIYGELGRLPLIFSRHTKIIKYWLSIVLGKKSLFINKLYMSSLAQHENSRVSRHNNWSFHVKMLLFESGLNEAWYNQGVADCIFFLSLFKQRVRDINIQN